MKDIVILGSGGFAKEVAFLIDEINENTPIWNLLGFIDEKSDIQNSKYTIIGNDDWLLHYNKPISVVIGIGDSSLISKLSNVLLKNKNIEFPNLIHPNAIGDWKRIELGKGNIICASNTLTTDIKIGDFNIVNLSCTIGHDTVMGNNNVVNPSVNISGGVNIENNCLLGTGSKILQYLKIGSNTIIGSGAVVTKNIDKQGVYVGMPAKKITK